MNYGKLTAGTTKTAIDTAKPSEKGEIITYLSRMGDVLEPVAQRRELVILPRRVNAAVDGDIADVVLREDDLDELAGFQVITAQAR